MEIKEFIEHFAEQFEETEADVLKLDTKFRELDEWSSLLALSVMAMINEEYDITISADEMREAQTIEALFNTVKSYC